MPDLRVGLTQVSNLKVGTNQAQKVYIGSTQIWARAQDWIGSLSSLSYTARSSTWGPALVPSGRTAHWDASHEASFTYSDENTLVSQWNDLSGNGWWLITANALSSPDRIIGYNGLPIVHFEGPEWLVHWIPTEPATPDDISLAQPITVHVVGSAKPYTGYGAGFIGGSGGGTGPGFQISVLPDGTLVFYAGNFGVNYSGHGYDQHIITSVFNGASSVQRVDGTNIGTANVGTNEWTRPQMSITHNVLDYMDVCEIVFYNRVLTGPEITYNETLLQNKWFKPAGVWTGSAATITIQGTNRPWFVDTAPAFRPDSIENCFAWWDASDSSTFSYSSGVVVSQWRDKTTLAHHLVPPATGPNRTGLVNGLPVVTFTGTSWLLMYGGGGAGLDLPPQPFTFFAVASIDSGGFYGLLGGVNAPQIQRRGDNGLLSFDSSVRAEYSLDTSTHLIGAVFDKRLSQQRVDGVQLGTVDTGPLNFGEMRLAAAANPSDTLHGVIAEVCIYSTRLNTTEIADVENYLLKKWFVLVWTGTAATLDLTATSSVWSVASLPGAPTLDSATPGDTQVALSWTAGTAGSSATTDYLIEKSPNGSSSWTTVTDTVSTATAFTVTSLTNGVIQYFRISAINAVGTGPVSNVLSATPTAAVTVANNTRRRRRPALTYRSIR